MLEYDIYLFLTYFTVCNRLEVHPLRGASVRNSAHGKGHEEGGLAYAKA